MKTIHPIKSQLLTLFVATAIMTVLSSFAFMGAHSFVIQLDDKQIAEQYVAHDMQIPEVVIESNEIAQNLMIKYSECGRTVSARKLTIKDNHDKILKEWAFDGSTSGFKDPMKISIKDLVMLKQRSNNTLKLFYSSNEFPQGQQIAILRFV